MPPSPRETLLARARAARDSITPQEDAAITAAALGDPDALPNKPRRGRPPTLKGEKKEAVMLRLDPDVLAHFRSGGEGWQTRINAALRETAGLTSRTGRRIPQ